MKNNICIASIYYWSIFTEGFGKIDLQCAKL